MKKALLLCALGAAFFVGQAARADQTFDFSFSGNGLAGNSFSSGPNVTFTASSTGTNGNYFGYQYTAYQINSISGTMTIGSDTYTITGIDTPPNITGQYSYVDLHNGNYGLYPNSIDFDVTKTSGSATDTFYEIAMNFDLANGTYSFQSWTCFLTGGTCYADDTGSVSTESITVDPGAAPEPGSLALLGTSILGGAGVLRRRFRA
jgi:hypothetical protein